MRWAFRIFVVAALALPIAALAAIWMCFDDQPLVVQRADLSMDTYEKAQQFMETHDPRTAGAGVRTIVASQDEVNLVLSSVARRFNNAAVHAVLRAGVARVQASVATPSSPFGSWLNFDAVLRETQGVPTFEKLKIGSLPVPAFVAEFALEKAVARFGATEKGRIAQDMVKSVALLDSQVRVVYEWREDLVDRARAALVPREDQERFRAYSERLFKVVTNSGRQQSITVAELLPPMFLLAKQRSAKGDAAKENRAAIITLAFFAFGRDLSAIIPAAAQWPAPVPLQVTLYDREDAAQHFLVSAALAAEGGSALSNAIGVYREMDDSRRTGTGKGFSFQDLAADVAGTRLGTLAAGSPQRLQQALSPGIKESDIMPTIKDLPEEIPEAVFKKKYGGIGSPAYNNILADIEARVARTPILR